MPSLRVFANEWALHIMWLKYWVLFIAVIAVIIIIHNGFPQRTQPFCLLKCLCSAHREIMGPCPPVNGHKGEINSPLPKSGASWRCFARLRALFTLLPHCPSLSILPFDFSSSSRLSLVL